MCTHSPESQWDPKMHDWAEGGDSAPLLWPCETSPGALTPAFGFPVQERHESAGARPKEGHKTMRRMKHVCLQGRLKDLGLF